MAAQCTSHKSGKRSKQIEKFLTKRGNYINLKIWLIKPDSPFFSPL